MELLKRHKLIHDKNPKAILDATEVKEIEEIEDLLPLHALIVFRQLVMKEVIILQHKAQQEKEKSKTTTKVSTFFKSRFGSKKRGSVTESGSHDDEDISLQEVSQYGVRLMCIVT
jgi:hypothetical protein